MFVQEKTQSAGSINLTTKNQYYASISTDDLYRHYVIVSESTIVCACSSVCVCANE